LGAAHLQVGDAASASPPLEAALAIEPDRPLTLVALGLALNARKLYAEAKVHLLRSLAIVPGDLEAIAALGESEEGLGHLEEAAAHAQRVLKDSADHVTANLVMGMVFMKQERYAEARRALEKVVAGQPGSSKGHYQLSLACARLGDEPAAKRHLALYESSLRQATAGARPREKEAGGLR
jgi:tetratricopeptide (TPR) repeat protein